MLLTFLLALLLKAQSVFELQSQATELRSQYREVERQLNSYRQTDPQKVTFDDSASRRQELENERQRLGRAIADTDAKAGQAAGEFSRKITDDVKKAKDLIKTLRPGPDSLAMIDKKLNELAKAQTTLSKAYDSFGNEVRTNGYTKAFKEATMKLGELQRALQGKLRDFSTNTAVKTGKPVIRTTSSTTPAGVQPKPQTVGKSTTQTGGKPTPKASKPKQNAGGNSKASKF